MAAPYNPPVKNEDLELPVALEDYANPGNFRVNPTLAAGDVQISKDDGAFANVATLPSVAPSGSRMVDLVLSSTEMNADKVVVQFVDQTAPKEWSDLIITILTTSA